MRGWGQWAGHGGNVLLSDTNGSGIGEQPFYGSLTFACRKESWAHLKKKRSICKAYSANSLCNKWWISCHLHPPVSSSQSKSPFSNDWKAYFEPKVCWNCSPWCFLKLFQNWSIMLSHISLFSLCAGIFEVFLSTHLATEWQDCFYQPGDLQASQTCCRSSPSPGSSCSFEFLGTCKPSPSYWSTKIGLPVWSSRLCSYKLIWYSQ